MVRELVLGQLVGPLVEALGAPDPLLRATLIGSQVIGLAIVRYVIAVEPLASTPAAELAAAVAPTFQRYLVGDLGGASDTIR